MNDLLTSPAVRLDGLEAERAALIADVLALDEGSSERLYAGPGRRVFSRQGEIVSELDTDRKGARQRKAAN